MLDKYNFTLLNTGEGTYQKSDGNMSVLDLSLASNTIANKSNYNLLDNTLGSDHLPAIITIGDSLQRDECFTQTWNLNKADWTLYRNNILNNLTNM